MTESVVIRLPTGEPARDGDASHAEWAVVDGTGACVAAPASGPLAGATAACQGRRVIVLVPAARVLRMRVDVPVKGASKITQALPFALEDLLAEDVEELHFAAGARYPDEQVPVAVVRRELMGSWLARLESAGIRPQAMYADSDGVPDVSGNATLLLEDQHAVLREPGSDPVVSEPESLEDLLELWLAQPRAVMSDGATGPRNLQVYDATVDGVPNAIWQQFQDRVESLEVRRLPDGALLRLAAAIVTSPGVNLLQGDYATRTGTATYWPRWRLAAALAVAVAGAVVAGAAVDTWRLRRESAALDAEIRQAASYTFPGVDPAGDLRSAVTARLKGEPGAGGKPGASQFLDTLQTVAVAVAKTGNARIEALNYRSGVLELQVRAPNAEALESIRRIVTEAGKLKADIQSSNASGDEIQGRIRISGA